MPFVKGKKLTPDEAIVKSLCPECGKDLTTVNPIAEYNLHWPALPNNPSRKQVEAVRRAGLLQRYIREHNVTTSNMPKPAAPAAPAA